MHILGGIDKKEEEYINSRVNYYNRLPENVSLEPDAISLNAFKRKEHLKVYYFDFMEIARLFPTNLKVHPLFGDIDYSASRPSITKSRPVNGDNSLSVIMKLERIRHFMFIKDRIRFEAKKNMLVGRGKIKKEHRIRFFQMYFGHPMCNLGEVARHTAFPQWKNNRMTIDEHLQYKFILCLEGNDVASNLKWVMSSNSLAVMPKPKFETWFMEGTLIPDYHYVLIKDDYSDLEERLNFFIQNPGEANRILENAHKYVNQFRNRKRERKISVLVLREYFRKTGQLK